MVGVASCCTRGPSFRWESNPSQRATLSRDLRQTFQAITWGRSALEELAPIPVVLRLHLGEKLNELRRLTDAVKKGVARVARIQVVTPDRRFSQPLDGVSTLAFERIDAGNVVGVVMIKRILGRMRAKSNRNLGFRGAKI